MTMKEKLLEEKLITLEQRLVLVERFVELRFSETFRDFTTRHGKSGSKKTFGSSSDRRQPPNDDDDDDKDDTNDNAGPRSTSSKSARTTRQSSTKGVRKPGPASSKRGASSGNQAKLQDCVVQMVKCSDKSFTGQQQTLESASESPTTHRYGTRKRTRMSETKVKLEVLDDVENDNDGSSTLNEMVGNFDSLDEQVVEDNDELVEVSNHPGEDEDEGGEYFTFPTDHNDSDGDVDQDIDSAYLEAADDNDANWNGSDDDNNEDADDDVDYVAPKSGNKGKHPRKRQRQSTATGEGKGKIKHSGQERKKKSHIYYLASMSDLSKDTKIDSADPTRAECPICKQYWKVERLDKHISSHMKERHLKCSQCDKTYFSTEDLSHHMKITHLRAKYFPKCRICHTPVVRKMILHEKYCVKKTLQNGEEVDPALVEDIRQKCAKEGLEFVLPDETVPPGMDPTERIECKICKKSYQRRVYDRHVKSHSLARNWKCTKCPKTYIHKHDLIRHMCITHEVSLKCKFCEETFETRMQLRTHQVKCRKSKGLVPRPRSSHLGYKAVRAIDPPDSLDIVLNADSNSANSTDHETTENDTNVPTAEEDERVPADAEDEAMVTTE